MNTVLSINSCINKDLVPALQSCEDCQYQPHYTLNCLHKAGLQGTETGKY